MHLRESTLLTLPPGLRADSFTASPEGSHVAFAAQAPTAPIVMRPWDKLEDVMPQALAAAGGECCWMDGAAGPPYAKIERIVFSRDGEHLAYVAAVANNLRLVVLDGQPQTP